MEKKDAEKDKASLNTTLTGTQTHTQTHSTRQKEAKSLSDVAHSNTATSSAEGSSSLPTKPTPAKKAKTSLLSRLLSAFVPCVGPSKRAHDLDSHPVLAVPAAPANPQQEKADAKDMKELPPKPSVSMDAPTPPAAEEKPQQIPEQQEAPVPLHPVPERPETPAPLHLVDIPDQSEDPDVVVPVTPTKLLPRDETEGLTSGAVVPPGATGHAHQDSQHEHEHHHHHTHSQDSENESDGSTSLTEEESDDEGPMDEIEDEEERLILAGGAGIPVGAVSGSLSPRHPIVLTEFSLLLGRCTKTIIATSCPKTCWAKMPGA